MKKEELKYTKDHLWVGTTSDAATIGITDYAQQELGDIVFVEMPEQGSETKKGETFGTVESVKSVSDLVAPISGEVIETNKILEDNPETINSSPFEEGWIIKVKMADAGELDALLDYTAYSEFLESEG
jgi:glycine cleavage system H protein